MSNSLNNMSCAYCKETTHYIRDNEGAVTCPSLANAECNFCKEKGHTTKHCPIIKEKGGYDPNYNVKKRTRDYDRETKQRMYEKYGNFWPLLIESTREDNEIAKSIRRDRYSADMRKDFRSFLYDRYRSNWLYRSEGSRYDCAYLEHLRNQDIQNDIEREMYKRRRMMQLNTTTCNIPNGLFTSSSSDSSERRFSPAGLADEHFFSSNKNMDNYRDVPFDSRLNNYVNKRKFDDY